MHTKQYNIQPNQYSSRRRRGNYKFAYITNEIRFRFKISFFASTICYRMLCIKIKPIPT